MGQPPYPPQGGQSSYGQGGPGGAPYGSQPPYGQPSANVPYGQPSANVPYGQPSANVPYGAQPGQLGGQPAQGGYGQGYPQQPGGYGPQGPQPPVGYGASPQGPAPKKKTGLWIAIGAVSLALVLLLGGLVWALSPKGEKADPSTTQPTTTQPAPTTTQPTTTQPAPTTTKPAPTSTQPLPTTLKPTPTTTGPVPTTTGPKPTGSTHTVEYRVKASGGEAEIDYQDLSTPDGTSATDKTSADWTKTYTVTSTSFYASVLVSAADYSSKVQVSCELLIDGQVVKTDSGTSFVYCSKIYI